MRAGQRGLLLLGEGFGVRSGGRVEKMGEQTFIGKCSLFVVLHFGPVSL